MSFLPPFEFGPRPGSEFPRFDHLSGLKNNSHVAAAVRAAPRRPRRSPDDVTGVLTCPGRPVGGAVQPKQQREDAQEKAQ